jgi:UDP-glucuronate 4-epimerase
MKIIVTGAAGFIGMHCAQRLIDRGDTVLGVDNLNDYYDVSLKRARLAQLQQNCNFSNQNIDISNKSAMKHLFDVEKPCKVVHLAAQAGVRYSLENPHAYIDANINGFMNVLEGCRQNDVKHLVYASSSSVYGGNEKMPFSEHHNVDHPISLYAATKKSNELMAHAYSHLYRIPVSGLRFFTVYGPWGRPDMALFLFAQAMLRGETIDLFNDGNMVRDFTYIDDIVEGVIRVLDKPATVNFERDPNKPDPCTSNAPYRIFNIGNGQPTQLLDYVRALEASLGISAKIDYHPMQPGDVMKTSADTRLLEKWIGFKPFTTVDTGVRRFVEWFVPYYESRL